MKKNYITPEMKMLVIRMEGTIAVSNLKVITDAINLNEAESRSFNIDFEDEDDFLNVHPF